MRGPRELRDGLLALAYGPRRAEVGVSAGRTVRCFRGVMFCASAVLIVFAFDLCASEEGRRYTVIPAIFACVLSRIYDIFVVWLLAMLMSRRISRTTRSPYVGQTHELRLSQSSNILAKEYADVPMVLL
ncbi:hypothetical protein C2E23DRAFT_358087 [Lenzites betulinus]|nr:hypothetical protein C2E23DRAFT_358087 [Lenzites betulinus]